MLFLLSFGLQSMSGIKEEIFKFEKVYQHYRFCISFRTSEEL